MFVLLSRYPYTLLRSFYLLFTFQACRFRYNGCCLFSCYLSMFVFSDALLEWFDVHGRHDLPWQVTDDPYKVWVSEIMLQQTQVKTVLQYYERFIQRFPTVQDLGQASWDEVAPYWAGLGYYARARNLHKAAGMVTAQQQFPQTLEQWIALPGIGRSTAGALMSLGLRQYGVIMDGNVKRVLSRFFAIEDDLSKPVHERALWQLARSALRKNHCAYIGRCSNIAKHISKVWKMNYHSRKPKNRCQCAQHRSC